MDKIKKFMNSSTTSSIIERRVLFDELFEVLNNPKNGNYIL